MHACSHGPQGDEKGARQQVHPAARKTHAMQAVVVAKIYDDAWNGMQHHHTMNKGKLPLNYKGWHDYDSRHDGSQFEMVGIVVSHTAHLGPQHSKGGRAKIARIRWDAHAGTAPHAPTPKTIPLWKPMRHSSRC